MKFHKNKKYYKIYNKFKKNGSKAYIGELVTGFFLL